METEVINRRVTNGRVHSNKDFLVVKEVIGEDAIKENTLNNLTVTTQSGKVFYADKESRSDINEAINIAEDEGQISTFWKLAEEFEGNRIVEITLDELKEVRKLALVKKGQLVGAIN